MCLVTQYKNIKQKLSELEGKISKSMDMRDFNFRIPLKKKTSQLINKTVRYGVEQFHRQL